MGYDPANAASTNNQDLAHRYSPQMQRETAMKLLRILDSIATACLAFLYIFFVKN